MIMEGRFDDHKMGEAFLLGGQARLPMNYTCLDPLNRVQGLRVEVWTGMPGVTRPTRSRSLNPRRAMTPLEPFGHLSRR